MYLEKLETMITQERNLSNDNAFVSLDITDYDKKKVDFTFRVTEVTRNYISFIIDFADAGTVSQVADGPYFLEVNIKAITMFASMDKYQMDPDQELIMRK